MTPLRASVLIATKDGAEGLERVVRSLLASHAVELEILVMDQSAGDETADVVMSLDSDRVRYIRASRVGKSAALNEGLRIAAHEYVLMTDDDCEAPPDWAPRMVALLDEDPRSAVVFSRVTAPAYDRRLGYTPTYDPVANRTLRHVVGTCRGRGLGAGMAVRRSAVISLGGMDEALGPGGRFGASEDWDLEVRALLKGWNVAHSADAQIVHHGYRSHSEGAAHAGRDWLGIGAMLAKLLRGGHPSGLILLTWELGRGALLPPVADIARLRRPRGLSRIVAFGRGFAQALRLPVDRSAMVFTPGARNETGWSRVVPGCWEIRTGSDVSNRPVVPQ